MPSRFWGEAVRHAVYILNRATTKALHDSTPQEAWTGRKLRLDHLRVFGCIAYMKIPAAHLKKLDDRSIPMVYLGVEAGCKAHRLFDPHHNKVHISRDVIFEESKSWMWSEAVTDDQDIWATFSIEEPDIEENKEARTLNSPGMPSDVTMTSDVAPDTRSSPLATPKPTDVAPTLPATMGSLSPPDSSKYDDKPGKFRSLAEIYEETEELHPLSEELLQAEMHEPVTFFEAVKEKQWVEVMDQEITSIEKNKT